MAIKNIDYDAKESLQNDENIPNKNKVTDSDMNQIKDVVNNNAKELETAENNITELDKVVAQNKEKNNEQDEKINSNTSKIEELENNKVDKVDGKGLSTNDFTNEYKKKLDGLSNYNDEKIKQDISDIQKEQETQNDNIESIQKVDEKQDELIQKLKDNSINITTEESTSLHIEDASELPAKLDVRGNHYQKVTETAENVFNGKLEPGEWNYNTGEKTDVENRIRSVDYIDITGQTQISTVKKNGGTFGLAIRFYDADKNYIGRVSSPEVVDGVTNNVNNDLDSTKTVKYATLTILDTSDTSLEFGVNKGADLTWHDFIPNSPSLAYSSEVRAVGDNVNILPNEAASTSNNGMDFTVNADDSIHAVGTATSNAQLILAGQMSSTVEIMKLKKGIQYKNVGNIDILYRDTNLDYARLQAGNIFTVDEDVSIGCFYIQINSGETVDETYYPKIVEYYEEIDESYSPYEQGAVGIKKINTNLLNNKQVFKDIGRSINGLTISQNEDGSIILDGISTKETQFWFYFSGVRVVKGYKFDKYVRAGSISDEKGLSLEFYNKDIKQICLNNFNNNVVKENDIITTGYVKINQGVTFDNYTINYAISKETLNKFVENEETNYTLPIQKEMLRGDFFDLQRGKEVHAMTKIIVDGVNKTVWDVKKTDKFIQFGVTIGFIVPGKAKVFSNCFLQSENYGVVNTVVISAQGQYLYFHVRPDLISEVTNEAVNSLLKQMNEEGNPLSVYVTLDEAEEIDLTKEQKEVLQQLQELGLFKDTNNIITAEDLALLQLQYIADTKNYIDKEIENKVNEKLVNINTQILELAGGN